MAQTIAHRLDYIQLNANMEALPVFCFTRHVSTGRTVCIIRGLPGYMDTPECDGIDPDTLNTLLVPPPTRQQVRAMEVGSIFGWDQRGAHPGHPVNVVPSREAQG